MKLLSLNSMMVQRHLVVLGPTAQALTFSNNRYLIINHHHDLVFTFGETFGSKGCTGTVLHVSEACDPKCHRADYTVPWPRANRREAGIDCLPLSSELLAKNKASLEAIDLSLTAGKEMLDK